VGDRRLGDSVGRHLDRVEFDLHATKLDSLIMLQLTAGGEKCSLAARGYLVRYWVWSRGSVGVEHSTMSHLDGAGLIPEHDELHLLLIPDRIHPSRYGDRSVSRARQILDQSALAHLLNFSWFGNSPAPRASSSRQLGGMPVTDRVILSK